MRGWQKRTFSRRRILYNTFALCTCRNACTTFGTSSRLMGFILGCSTNQHLTQRGTVCVMRTMKSGSSIFFPFFFFEPLSSMSSSASVMPSASR